jgi:hypothetical protein
MWHHVVGKYDLTIHGYENLESETVVKLSFYGTRGE